MAADENEPDATYSQRVKEIRSKFDDIRSIIGMIVALVCLFLFFSLLKNGVSKPKDTSQEDSYYYDGTSTADSKHPMIGRFYYDYAGIMDKSTKDQVQAANPLNADQSPIKGTPQIVVMTLQSTNGEPIASWANELLDQKEWKFGDALENNGVLLLFAQNNGKNNVRISTGYGLEADLPDAKALAILNMHRNDLKSDDQAKVNKGLRGVLSDLKVAVVPVDRNNQKGSLDMRIWFSEPENVFVAFLIVMVVLDWSILNLLRRRYSRKEAIKRLILVQSLMLADLLSAGVIGAYTLLSGHSGSGSDGGSYGGSDYSGGGSSFGGGDFGGGGADI